MHFLCLIGIFTSYATINSHAFLNLEEKQGLRLIANQIKNDAFLFDKNTGNSSKVGAPLSFSIVKSMVCYATFGQIKRKCLNELGVPEGEGQSVERGYSKLLNELAKLDIHIKSRLFVPSDGVTPKQHYVEILRNAFNAEIEAVPITHDVMDKKYVTDWIEAQTKTKLTEIYRAESAGSNPQLLFVNTIYFKGFWKTLFDEYFGTRMSFHSLGGAGVDVAAVKKVGLFRLGRLDDCKARFIELPFKKNPTNNENTLSMFIIMPNEYESNEWKNLVPDLKKINLMERLSSSEEKTVRVSIPKFEIVSELSASSMNSSRQSFDLELPDNPFITFPIMSRPFKITEFSQAASKVVIQLTEDGVGFAASSGAFYNEMRIGSNGSDRMTRSPRTFANGVETGSNRMTRSVRSEAEEFKVDRPFVAVIAFQGEIKTILFTAHFSLVPNCCFLPTR